ncbi:hypothetical protein BN938_1157 [Mucinivorans hirudinis]|uniref:Rrf2 family transcriptional regulator n=1 Tax=Mucinivorans hirudinis TaxID=1433126 RepID=A0A060R7M9_9BACT|nr:hypothetical protein BN938_1157 [Mucinivorans hirudinis]
MIRIATRLGVMACRYLVQGYYENRYIPAPEIAGHYNMNVRALMPALHQLTRAGILRSRVGGTTPGFIFAKDPKEFSLHQLMVIMEGEPHFECCKEIIPDLKCGTKKCDGCGIYSLFHGVIDNAKNKFSAINIVEDASKLFDNA